MCTIPLIVFNLVISHASPRMNTAKFNIKVSDCLNFPPCARTSDAWVVYRSCRLLPMFVDRQWIGYGRENGGQS